MLVYRFFIVSLYRICTERYSTIQKHIENLKNKGIIRREGSDKSSN